MYENNRKVEHLLEKIAQSLEIILDRCASISTVNDFLDTPEGMSLLDGICMRLIAVGESVKNLDKLTDFHLLLLYPQIPWREIKGIRDIIVHHYFEIDADVIWATVKEDIPYLLTIIRQLQREI